MDKTSATPKKKKKNQEINPEWDLEEIALRAQAIFRILDEVFNLGDPEEYSEDDDETQEAVEELREPWFRLGEALKLLD